MTCILQVLCYNKFKRKICTASFDILLIIVTHVIKAFWLAPWIMANTLSSLSFVTWSNIMIKEEVKSSMPAGIAELFS